MRRQGAKKKQTFNVQLPTLNAQSIGNSSAPVSREIVQDAAISLIVQRWTLKVGR
jgi:hypothetical protein